MTQKIEFLGIIKNYFFPLEAIIRAVILKYMKKRQCHTYILFNFIPTFLTIIVKI